MFSPNKLFCPRKKSATIQYRCFILIWPSPSREIRKIPKVSLKKKDLGKATQSTSTAWSCMVWNWKLTRRTKKIKMFWSLLPRADSDSFLCWDTCPLFNSYFVHNAPIVGGQSLKVEIFELNSSKPPNHCRHRCSSRLSRSALTKDERKL